VPGVQGWTVEIAVLMEVVVVVVVVVVSLKEVDCRRLDQVWWRGDGIRNIRWR
jgi:hypothetical protein